MDHSKLVLAQAFGSQSEADLAKSMLESAGIDAMVQADTAGGMRPHIAWSGLGFRVLVREEDVAEARGVLEPPEGVSAAKLVASSICRYIPKTSLHVRTATFEPLLRHRRSARAPWSITAPRWEFPLKGPV